MDIDESVGKFLDKYLRKKASRLHADALVELDGQMKKLKIFYHLLGGEKGKELHITDKRFINTSRTFLEKLTGGGRSFFLAWQDEKALYLPATLSFFSLQEHNDMHYYWLIAMFTKVDTTSKNIQNENEKAIKEIIESYPGFKTFYTYAQNYLTTAYPELFYEGISDDTPSQNSYPNPLWVYPALTTKNSLLDFNDDEEIGRDQRQDEKVETLQMKKQAEQIDDKKETDGLLLFLPESIMSLMEQVNVDRQENDSFDEDALYDAEDLDEITLGKKDANLSARLKMDLDISANSVEEYPLGKGRYVDEWDYKKECYLQNYARILPHTLIHVAPMVLPTRLKKLMKKIQLELDLMQLDRIKKDNLPYGDEINLDTWIDFSAHQNHSLHQPNFFESYERQSRDMATLILADVSLSTEAGITQEIRVVDAIKDSLMIFSEALLRLKDRFSIYTFSSVKNTKVHFQIVKNFNEKYSDTIRGRIDAIKPGYYTRMGAAIRESSKILKKEQSENKLLLILSDGKPNDVDRYDGRYGIEDTKKAIDEAKKMGITPFCITIDIDAKEYLPYIFGKNSYAVIHDAKKLPKLIPEIYINLTL